LAVLARSLVVQASWNTRTMLGHGFAFALKPVLWWRYPDEASREAALARHVEHFNAHPYLSPMGLGAAARLEVDGEDPRRIRHFKTAVRGPLGAIGDRLVWVGWLPSVALVAVILITLGVHPLWVVLGFLSIYNAGHVYLRIWGWSAGYRHGGDVAQAIRGARLQGLAEGLSRCAALLLGLTLGILPTQGTVGGRALWVSMAAVLFLSGNRARRKGWRPILSLTAAVIGLVAVAATLVDRSS